ncbi:MAG: response regulator [Ruminococcaceae bacterium]|nr:response regulator [Oscillospiraceae bacterium]
MRKLVVVDESPWVVRKLSTLLKNTYEVYGTSEPSQIMELLETVKPDVYVADVMMPGGEAMDCLRHLCFSGSAVTLIATSRYAPEGLLEELENLGVSCLMVKPYLMPALAARILEFDNRAMFHTPQGIVNTTLLNMGFRPDLQGFRILVEACAYVMEHPDCTMTKELYPELARRFQGTTSQIERACRECISKAWAIRDIAFWRQYFAESRLRQRRPVSNGHFLKQMAVCLNMHQGNLL